MKTATAETGRADGRSAQRIAEKMAKNAGVDFGDWVAEAVAEYAEDLGVEPEELSERERLEAIEDRIDRLARRAPPQDRIERRESEPSRAARGPEIERPAPRGESRTRARSDSRPSPLPPEDDREDRNPPVQDRLSQAIEAIEQRAQRNERRAARVLESVASVVDGRDGDASRLESTIKQIEKRAERSEARTARAFESLAGLAQERGGERSRLEETIKQIESRTERNEKRTARALESLTGLVDTGGGERDRLAAAVQQIETRSERNEERTARALESLSGLVETRNGDTSRLEAAIKQVEGRAERNEERAARALESLSSLVEARGGEPERLEEAIKQIEARTERNAGRTTRALESLKGLVESRQGERERLEAAIERIGARANENEARTAQTLQSLTSLIQDKGGEPAAPRQPTVSETTRSAQAPIQPAQPAGKARAPARDEDTEALRLVSERLARRRQLRNEAAKPTAAAAGEEAAGSAELSRPATPAPLVNAAIEAKLDEVVKAARAHDFAGTIQALQHDLSLLAERVEVLSDASVGSAALDAIRRQTEDIQAALAAATRSAAPVERLERQIGELAERFAGAAAAPAEIAAAVKTLVDAQAKIERASPAAALQAIERRIDELGSRVEEAARRPTLDPRPLEDLVRRVETIRTTIERQGGKRPETAVLASALQIINDKLDRASAAGAQSASTMATLQEMTSRLEEAIQRPASVSLDARPIEDLARRIDGVKGAVERQSAVAPKIERLEASVNQLSQKLDRPAAMAGEVAGIENAVKALAKKIDTVVGRNGAADFAAIEELTRRIESVRIAVEPNAALSDQVEQLHFALDEIRARLDRPAQSPQMEAVDATLRRLAEKFEQVVNRPAAELDLKPMEELARRIDGVKGAVEQHVFPHTSRVEAALGEIRDRLDRPAKPETTNLDAALRQLAARVDQAVSRPLTVALDPKPIEDLARRIDSVKGAVERQAAPDNSRLEASLDEIRDRLNNPGAIDAFGFDTALQRLASQVEAAISRGAAVDPAPMEDLARRIDSVKGAVERQAAPDNTRLEAALDEIRDRLDNPASIDAFEFDAALQRLTSQVEAAISRGAAVDPAPMEDLARRIDSVKGAVERQAAPDTSRLEAALDEIRDRLDNPARAGADVDAALRQLASRVDEAVNRPTTVALDPKPIEDLARRIESVRASLERPQTFGPEVERLETALGAVADRLDRAGPLIDPNGLNTTLSAMNARLEEAFRRPASYPVDNEPIEALARRVEAVRETIERQAEKIDIVGRPIGELSRRLDAVRESVEKQTEQLDLTRLEETFRAAVARLDRPGAGSAEVGALVEAMERLAAKVERSASAFDISRLETLLQDIALRVDIPRGEGDAPVLLAAIQELSARLGRGASSPDVRHLEGLVEQILDKVEDRDLAPGDMQAVVGALSELSDRVTRAEGPVDLAPLEDLLHDVTGRLDRLDAKVSAKSEGTAEAEWTQVETLLREFIEQVGDFRSLAENRTVDQDIRSIHDKLDDLADARFDTQIVEHAARTIADKIEQRALSANPEAMLGHVQEIHERLDDLVASRPAAAALERSVAELTDEMEALRLTNDSSARDSAVIAEVRAEQLQLDRRLDARFASLREVLETLLDRLARLERSPVAETTAGGDSRPPVNPPPADRLALHDIPDRPQTAPRLQSALGGDTSPLAAQIAAQGRARETVEGAAKTAAISAHIAAARRAANAAAGDADLRTEQQAERAKAQPGLVSRARSALAQRRSPVLLGGAAAMAIVTGFAVMELRGHAPVRKSEVDAPAAPQNAHSEADAKQKEATASDYDLTPTGSLATASPKVAASPLPTATSKPELTIVKPSSELIAAMPAGLPTSLAAAGSNGDVGAEIEIGQRYLEGRTVPRDAKMAAGWLQAAADAGAPFAQYRVGALYEKGVGVTRDAAKAREWYTKAANAGNVRAMHNLAVLYAQDGGAGKPDYANALDWFRRAASYGVRDSQFNLGVLYGRGLGATQDLASAWMYFSLAAKQGDADAARKRDEVSNRMDGKIMGAATKMMADFKVKTPDSATNDAPAAPADAAAQNAPADASKGEAKPGGKADGAKS